MQVAAIEPVAKKSVANLETNTSKSLDVEEREENLDVEEREKERERGSNLRRQRLASPTAQVLVAQTTQPVQKESAS